ncbi:hypothetical protein ABZ819_04970 [Streptomyces venezuelae]|uniref:hypothetical protein n=1 Tax=Streptomyces venezuelae TaxID=54571 RepID=UPI0034170446
MTADALAVIDTYATALTWAVRGWYAALLASAVVVIALGYLTFNRIGGSFRRAHQTIADTQQPREGEK